MHTEGEKECIREREKDRVRVDGYIRWIGITIYLNISPYTAAIYYVYVPFLQKPAAYYIAPIFYSHSIFFCLTIVHWIAYPGTRRKINHTVRKSRYITKQIRFLVF